MIKALSSNWCLVSLQSLVARHSGQGPEPPRTSVFLYGNGDDKTEPCLGTIQLEDPRVQKNKCDL